MTTLNLGNPVWKRFITTRVAEWLMWLKGIHLDSYIHLWDKYTDNVDPEIAAKKALEGVGNPNHEDSLIERLLIPPESFWIEMEKLAGEDIKITRMYKVALSATFDDILYEMQPYGESFQEIEKVIDFMSRKSVWFEVLLDHFRGHQYNLLKQAEKL